MRKARRLDSGSENGNKRPANSFSSRRWPSSQGGPPCTDVSQPSLLSRSRRPLSPAAAQKKANATLGVLDCSVEGATGFIIASQKNLKCVFTSANKKVAPETYVGVIKKFGLDIGRTRKALLRWRVLAPTGNVYAPGVLAGDYTGVSAEATVVVGGGANLLVGGSHKSFTLQPLSSRRRPV